MSHCGLRHVVQPVGERGAGGWRHSAVLLENGEPVARAIPLSRWLAPFRSGPVACAIPLRAGGWRQAAQPVACVMRLRFVRPAGRFLA